MSDKPFTEDDLRLIFESTIDSLEKHLVAFGIPNELIYRGSTGELRVYGFPHALSDRVIGGYRVRRLPLGDLQRMKEKIKLLAEQNPVDYLSKIRRNQTIEGIYLLNGHYDINNP